MSTNLTDTKNWTYEEFLSFLLIYAASADFEISSEETDLIKAKYGVETFEKSMVIFEGLNFMEQVDVILEFKSKYFSTEEELNKLFELIQELFDADGEFSLLEQNQYRALKRLMS
ncbi:MAG: hypothetical protein IH946_03830 [Bacteroidetes bacterium]|nr:hypothetical protein [Bacteroidota bacterium]